MNYYFYPSLPPHPPLVSSCVCCSEFIETISFTRLSLGLILWVIDLLSGRGCNEVRMVFEIGKDSCDGGVFSDIEIEPVNDSLDLRHEEHVSESYFIAETVFPVSVDQNLLDGWVSAKQA